MVWNELITHAENSTHSMTVYSVFNVQLIINLLNFLVFVSKSYVVCVKIIKIFKCWLEIYLARWIDV